MVALGTLAAEPPGGVSLRPALDGMFLLYALLGVVASFLYRRLSLAIEPAGASQTAPLTESRATVF